MINIIKHYIYASFHFGSSKPEQSLNEINFGINEEQTWHKWEYNNLMPQPHTREGWTLGSNVNKNVTKPTQMS